MSFYIYFKCNGLKAVINSTTDLRSTRYFKIIAAIKSVVAGISKRTADKPSHSKAFGSGLFGKQVWDWEGRKGRLISSHLDFKKIDSCKIKGPSVSHQGVAIVLLISKLFLEDGYWCGWLVKYTPDLTSSSDITAVFSFSCSWNLVGPRKQKLIHSCVNVLV